ncbi:MAG: Fe-S cluster assembly protein SufD [Hyphomicrobiales bacterium]|nr:Fe-S cluster assembly protein SufD [Hyphomicrobiales bacterium]
MNMELKQVRTEAETALEGYFAARLAAGEPAWLAARRQQAFAQLSAAGLPNRRVEAWHFTDLRRHMRAAFPPADRAAAEAVSDVAEDDPFAGLETARIVLVNGFLRRDLSQLDLLPEGVTVESFGEAVQGKGGAFEKVLGRALSGNGGAIAALNDAFAEDGLVLRIGENVQVATPVHLVFVNHAATPHASHARNLVLVGAGARASLIESHVGSGDYQASALTEMLIGDGAEVDHVKLQDQSPAATHLDLMAARLGASSAFRTFTLAKSGSLARSELRVTFGGPRGTLDASGALLARGSQHLDATLFVDHAVPQCASRQLYKAVLDETARGVFQGRILVRPHAQKTDGRQSSRALLLSERAEMDSKPELEIFADDVQCAHGSTTGRLDEEPLFYLRARGIPRKEAEALLVIAFIAEALEQVRSDEVRAVLQEISEQWLAGREA